MLAITHVERMETDLGATTAVVARTCIHITLPFVLLSWTVVHTVTAQEDRHAVAIVQTLEVGFWTLYVLLLGLGQWLKVRTGRVSVVHIVRTVDLKDENDDYFVFM